MPNKKMQEKVENQIFFLPCKGKTTKMKREDRLAHSGYPDAEVWG